MSARVGARLTPEAFGMSARVGARSFTPEAFANVSPGLEPGFTPEAFGMSARVGAQLYAGGVR